MLVCQVLLLSHPRASIRDTQTYPGIHAVAKSKRPGLRNLAKVVLGLEIQSGEHSSVCSRLICGSKVSDHLDPKQVEDARATMAIFRAFKTEWEASILEKSNLRQQKATAKSAPVVYKASSVDPTRRYKQNRTLGLASVVAAQLSTEEGDPETEVQGVQTEGTTSMSISLAVPDSSMPSLPKKKKSDAPQKIRAVSAPVPKAIAAAPKAKEDFKRKARTASTSASQGKKAPQGNWWEE